LTAKTQASKPKEPGTEVGTAPPGAASQAEGTCEPCAKAKAEREKARSGAHCPSDMVYVEGEYCTDASNDAVPDRFGNTPGGGQKDLDEVERECKREWYAEQNKKVVCEEFAPEVHCKGKQVPKRYCIDKYEWPNKKGALPEVMNRFHQAEVKCAAVGKRLCTESEWTFACEGPKMSPFPYGIVRDANKCHGDEEWDAPNMKKVAARDPKELRRLYQAEPSGEPECKSDFGVYDLPGNADEIAASETFDGKGALYDSVTTGGPWYKGVRNQCRPKIYTHDEGFYYYYLSFRCCAEPDGAETDPRTPKQRRAGDTMKKVERTAGISVQEMSTLLEKKKTDPTCGCKTTRCKTYCGTLLDDAKDSKKDVNDRH
jgi:formylglycine-generating enzyme